ncbi:MAG: MFS transporter, partial [Planctomycetes bacterium]|nr:MFS transporter [Planctomycetota bacterium]
MNITSKKRQWTQLIILTYVHFVVDVFAGMLPALLPQIREDYGLSRTRVIILLTVMNLVCNGTQIATGNLRAKKRSMLFLPVGLLLSAVMCLMALAPHDGSAEYWFYIMAVVSGIGIAIVHPEGLRAVHGLDEIPGSICTAVFMMGGFFGFAVGEWVSTELVMWRGGSLEGLYYLIPAALFGFVVLWMIKVRLSLEEDHENGSVQEISERLPFWLI